MWLGFPHGMAQIGLFSTPFVSGPVDVGFGIIANSAKSIKEVLNGWLWRQFLQIGERSPFVSLRLASQQQTDVRTFLDAGERDVDLGMFEVAGRNRVMGESNDHPVHCAPFRFVDCDSKCRLHREETTHFDSGWE